MWRSVGLSAFRSLWAPPTWPVVSQTRWRKLSRSIGYADFNRTKSQPLIPEMPNSVIHLSPQLNEKELRLLEGIQPCDGHYDKIIDFDVDAFDKSTKRHIFTLKNNAIPQEMISISENIFKDIESRMKPSFSRASAAGIPDIEKIRLAKKNVLEIEPAIGKPFHANIIYKSNRKGKTNICNPVNSYMAGWNYDRYKKLGKPCGFSKEFPSKWHKAIPYFESINSALMQICPEHYMVMHEWVKLNNISPNLTIGNTCLTTVAINVNYESCFHFDRGDYEDGYSTLTTISPYGLYNGGYLVLPKYRVAIDVKPGSILINQSHKDLHGNTRIIKIGQQAKRISFVTYLKKTLKNSINK